MGLRARWSKLSRKDQTRWLLVGTALVVGLYGLLVYPFSSKALSKSEGLVKRRIDRIEKRTAITGGEGASPAALSGRLSEVEKTHKVLSEQFEELTSAFVPPDSPVERQALLLELTTLAAASGLRVSSQGAEGSASGDEAVREQVDRVSGRNFLKVRASGGYWELMEFLRGLDALAWVSSPLGLELALVEEQRGQGQGQGQQGDDLSPRRAPGDLDIVLYLTL